MTLSVVIITKNESAAIERCLDSVKWADELIVLDSGSTDDTVSICRRFTRHVVQTDWPGFGPQKNRALERATGDWKLSMDADDQVTRRIRGSEFARLAQPTRSTWPRAGVFRSNANRVGGKFVMNNHDITIKSTFANSG